MSNEIWNDAIHIPLPFSGQVEYSNTPIPAYSGVTQMFNHTTHDRMTYTMDYTALTRTERNSIFDFTKDRKGSFDEFLFEDEQDNFVSRLSIGTGTGVASDVTFQLKDSKDNKRWDPKSAPTDVRIWQAGVEIFVGYTIGYTRSGIVTFAVAPLLGQNIEAEFYFRRRMRFTAEVFEWVEVNNNNVRVGGLKMREVIVT